MDITLAHIWLILAMFGAAVNSKALGLSIVFAISLLYAGVTASTVEFLSFFYVPAYILSSFRD
jgi:hypothetical protein